MTKANLVEIISKDTGIVSKDVAIAVDSFLEAIKDNIKEGKHIEIRKFGTFRLKIRSSKAGRNPKTGEKVQIPEKVVPTFKYSHSLRMEIGKLNPEDIK